MLLEIIPIILLLIFSVSCEKFRFDNYTLYKVLPKNVEEIKILEDLHNSGVEYDFWDDPVPTADYINVVSKPELKNDLESYLNSYGIDFIATLPNIQEVIDKETKKKQYTKSNFRSMEWNSYYTLEEIYDWLDDLAAAFPNIVSIIAGGTSYEGNTIKGIKISHGPGRRAVFIEGGIHSREWISPATVNYVINELLTSDDGETKAAARDYDWYIFPVTNPDGYIWTHVGYRLWRKNRRPFGDEFGVDLNRNWNDNWLKESVSTNPASNIYAGPGPFSEIETRTLSRYIEDMSDQIDLYLSFHSSGQILLLPFGNTTEPLANYYDAMKIGTRAMGALAFRYNTIYTIGNIAEAIYFATGTSIDWVKERLKVPLAYCYELRDRGTYGHLLPPEQILPTAEETMDSILEIIFQARRYGVRLCENIARSLAIYCSNYIARAIGYGECASAYAALFPGTVRLGIQQWLQLIAEKNYVFTRPF